MRYFERLRWRLTAKALIKEEVAKWVCPKCQPKPWWKRVWSFALPRETK